MLLHKSNKFIHCFFSFQTLNKIMKPISTKEYHENVSMSSLLFIKTVLLFNSAYHLQKQVVF
ncbi:hypothetical protein EGW74_00915 [Enterococcus casseliflavus]|nr:hypothetical protein EGW74_00915 [Enterococcus casseliflavus]